MSTPLKATKVVVTHKTDSPPPVAGSTWWLQNSFHACYVLKVTDAYYGVTRETQVDEVRFVWALVADESPVEVVPRCIPSSSPPQLIVTKP